MRNKNSILNVVQFPFVNLQILLHGIVDPENKKKKKIKHKILLLQSTQTNLNK